MQHPLRAARPTDPFLRFNLQDAQVVDYRVDGDHVAFVRPGRRAGELWVGALGDDPGRIVDLLDMIMERHGIDGIHVHADVYPRLPERLTIADPGHWSIWVARAGVAVPSLRRWASPVSELQATDARIDEVLAHSESAYVFAGDDSVRRWVGVERQGRLLAVGAESVIAGDVPHLVSICTDPQERGRGLGRAVTAALVSGAFLRGEPLVYLEMYADNAAGAALYRSVGFQEVARYRSGWLPRRGVPQRREPA
ncbi:MAG: GNAT family N-acetyltransferase [bacterium]